MDRTLVIGFDLDNTLACYEGIFHQAAVAANLIPPDVPSGKSAVRDYLRASGREDDWTRLQGQIYGPGMAGAKLFPGAIDVLCAARDHGHALLIVSHKTRAPALGPAHDLHAAARAWTDSVLCDTNQSPLFSDGTIHFCETQHEKVARIANLNCDVFVDDLPEILNAPDFPATTRRVLFDPDRVHTDISDDTIVRIDHWNALPGVIEHRADR